MSVDSQLKTRLRGFAGLTAIVGSRIHSGDAPQDTAFPYLTYFRVDGIPERVMGPSYPLISARFQFDAWAQSTASSSAFAIARSVIAQVRAALDPWSTSSGTIIQCALFISDGPDGSDEESKSQKSSIDYEINYEE